MEIEQSVIAGSVPTEEKPSLMQRIHDTLKKKWVTVAGGAVLSSAMLLGGAQNLNSQTRTYYSDADHRESFVGHVIRGDSPLIRGLDFVLEDFEKQNKEGQYMQILVKEPIVDLSNRDVIDEVRYRLDNPEQYPWIEVRGIFRPDNYDQTSGTLDLESILFTDVNQESEAFYTDPALSRFYTDFDRDSIDLIFFPGRHLGRIHYPHFGLYNNSNWYPEFDWDGDGIPNWLDPNPTWPDNWNWNWFNPHGWGLFNMWFSWDFMPWGFHNNHNGRGGWNNSYWNYWGGWNNYIDNDRHDNDNDNYGNVIGIIRKGQLQDPTKRAQLGEYVKRIVDNRNLKNRLGTGKYEELQKSRDEITRNIDRMRMQPQKIRIKDENGNIREVRMLPPGNYSPEDRGIRQYDPNRENTNRNTDNRDGSRIIKDNNERVIRDNNERVIKDNNGKVTRDGNERVIRKEASPPPPKNMPPPQKKGEIKKENEKKEIRKESEHKKEVEKKEIKKAEEKKDPVIKRDYEPTRAREYDSRITNPSSSYTPKPTTSLLPRAIIRNYQGINQDRNIRAPSYTPRTQNYTSPKSSSRTSYNSNKSYKANPSNSRTSSGSSKSYKASPSTTRSSGSYTRSSGNSTRSSSSSSRSSGNSGRSSSGSVRKK